MSGDRRRLAVTAALAVAVAGTSVAVDLSSNLELDLRATLEHAAYLHPGDPDRRTVGRLRAHALWAPVAWGEAEATVLATADSDGEIERRLDPDWSETALAPRSLEVRELRLAAHPAAADVAVGKLTVAWGVADLLRPTDAVTPRDLTDPLRDRPLGAWGAVVDLYPGSLDLTVAAVRHAPLRLPAADRRWFPVTTPVPVQLAPDLPRGSDAWIAALRLAGSGRGFDWTAVARHGPDLAPHVGAVEGTRVHLRYPDMTLLGGSVAAAVGGVVLRAEAAWRRYGRFHGLRVDEDFATVIAGVERRFPALLFDHDATVIAEVVHERHTGGPHLPREIAVLDPIRFFRTGLSLKLLLHNPTGWEAEAGLAADLRAGGTVVQLLVRRNVGDHVDLELAADILTAGGNPVMLPIAGNDRLIFRVVARL